VDSIPARADLHTHSTASDGLLAPADLIRQASRRGLSILALTDHDTTAGLDEATATGDDPGIRVIPGIELSCDVPSGETHLLGYGIDWRHDELQSQLEQLREARRTRLSSILDRLRDLGMTLDADALAPPSEQASVGRAQVARALVSAGYVVSVGEAFDRYLALGKPAYVASDRLTPQQAIALVRRVGGIPVLAHPFTSPGFEERLPDLIAAGLLGIEVYYGEYDDARRQQLAKIAGRHGLLATGGSDYHGEGFKEGRDLGSVDIPADVLDRFLAALDR
jgi:3',5'-nucleoside bisphosphate phosphatase